MERASSDAISASSSAAVSAAPSETDLGAAGAQGSDIALPSPAHPLSPAENDQLMEALSAELSVAAPVASCNSSPPDVAAAGRSAITGGAGGLVVMVSQPNSATSSSAGVAEAADALAAAADIAELQAALPRIQTSPEATAMAPASKPGGERATMAEQFVAAAVQADARTAQLASLAEQADLRGLERALDSLPQAEPVGRPTVKLQRQDTPPDPRRWAGHATCAGVGHSEGKRLHVPCSGRPMVCASVYSYHNPRALMRDRRAAAWKVLTPVERDALIVLTAMCKVGSSGAIICPARCATLDWNGIFCLLLCTMAALPTCWSPRPLAHEPTVFLAATMLWCRWRLARRGWAPWRATCTRVRPIHATHSVFAVLFVGSVSKQACFLLLGVFPAPTDARQLAISMPFTAWEVLLAICPPCPTLQASCWLWTCWCAC